MISHLTGKILYRAPDGCTIDVNGVGYEVHTSFSTFETLPDVGCEAKLAILTHVREDQITLFGFATIEEKRLFQRLIGVSGVGPKTALAMLSGMSPDGLMNSIISGDTIALTAIPGIGKKSAERIILELREKIAKDLQSSPASTALPRGHLREDAISALTNLGYQRAAAEQALQKIEGCATMPIEEAIRAALKELCRH